MALRAQVKRRRDTIDDGFAVPTGPFLPNSDLTQQQALSRAGTSKAAVSLTPTLHPSPALTDFEHFQAYNALNLFQRSSRRLSSNPGLEQRVPEVTTTPAPAAASGNPGRQGRMLTPSEAALSRGGSASKLPQLHYEPFQHPALNPQGTGRWQTNSEGFSSDLSPALHRQSLPSNVLAAAAFSLSRVNSLQHLLRVPSVGSRLGVASNTGPSLEAQLLQMEAEEASHAAELRSSKQATSLLKMGQGGGKPLANITLEKSLSIAQQFEEIARAQRVRGPQQTVEKPAPLTNIAMQFEMLAKQHKRARLENYTSPSLFFEAYPKHQAMKKSWGKEVSVVESAAVDPASEGRDHQVPSQGQGLGDATLLQMCPEEGDYSGESRRHISNGKDEEKRNKWPRLFGVELVPKFI